MRLRYRIISLLLTMIMLVCTGCQRKVQEKPKVVFQDPVFQAVFDREGYRETIETFTQVTEQEQLKALSIEMNEPVNLGSIGTMDNIKALSISAPGEEAGKFDWSFIENMEQLETLL